MDPIGLLMQEHRLIERMITVLHTDLGRISDERGVNLELMMTAADFFRAYDQTHHGKEENVLFRALAGRRLSQEHQDTLNELLEEHDIGRKYIAALDYACKTYAESNLRTMKDIIISCVNRLVNFYPAHIEKEDRHFFYPALEYLGNEERDNLLAEFWEFDRKVQEQCQDTAVQLENVRYAI